MSFESSECLNEEVYKRNYINRILNSTKNEDHHLYEIFVVTNCSWASYGTIELKGDTLNLRYSGTPVLRESSEKIIDVSHEIKGSDTLTLETVTVIEEIFLYETASCDCAFSLKYKIEGLENRDYIVTANDKLITKTEHKYKIVNNAPRFDLVENDTINLIDIYGLKQGMHIHKINGEVRSKFMFVDGKKNSGYYSYYNFKESYGSEADTIIFFDRIETYMENGAFSTRKYFNNKKLVKECDTNGTLDEGTNCRYYN